MTAAPQDQSNQGHRNIDNGEEPRPLGRFPMLSGLRVRILMLVALVLLPAFSVVFYAGYSERSMAKRDTERRALALTRQAAASESRLIADTRSLLALLTALPAVTRSGDLCPGVLKRYLSTQPYLSSIAVVDAAGHLICSIPRPTANSLDLGGQAYFRRAVARHAFALGNYRVDKSTGQPVLVAAYPVLTAAGQVNRVVVARLRLKWFDTLAAAAHLPTGSLFMMLDSNGRVLARYPSRSAAHHAMPGVAHKLGQIAAADGLTTDPVMLGAHQWLMTQTSLGETSGGGALRAVVAIPSAVAFASANRATAQYVTLLGGLTLFSVVLGCFVSDKLLVRPLRFLLHAARRLHYGELRARAEIRTGPLELRILGHTFDTMAASLEERLEEVESKNLRIARLNRILRVLSAVNGAIVRLRDRDQLLQEICQIAVELGHFPCAWIGLIEPEQDVVSAVAHAGAAGEFVQKLRISLDPDDLSGSGLVRDAIRTGRHIVSNDVAKDARLSSRWKEFSELNIRSGTAFPLRVRNRVVGAMALYASEPRFFDDRELALIDEIAEDASLGLENIERERELHYLAYWDPLTSLPNRTLFEDRLTQSLRRAGRSEGQVTVLVIDILRLNRLNDSKGRSAGDRALRTVAARLTAATRDSNSTSSLGESAARLGSHEFAILLDGAGNTASLQNVARRLATALAEPIALDDEDVSLTFRMGAASYPEHSDQAEDLVHKAMFAAHNEPIDAASQLAIYSPERDSAAKAHYALERDLFQAVEEGNFHLEYQPRVNALSGQLKGAEALLRWERPGYGPVPPEHFIPLLEENGLIGRVGEWVTRTALLQRLAWADRVADDFVISINVSSHELRSPDYVSRIHQIIKDLGAPSQWIEIEITETGLVETGSHTLELLSALSALGVRLSVDDFGTGYSSLSYLRHFPVNILKVDKSFIHDIARDDDALSLVQSIIALADALKLTAVAEGVETQEQVRLLADRGCNEIQGYYFSRPVSAAAFTECIASAPSLVS